MTLTVHITNTDAKPETIGTVTPPAAPLTASGLPAAGSTIPAGASVAVSVTYTPGSAQQHTSSLGLSGPAGAVTVPLTGTGVTGQAQLTVTPTTLDLGQVPVGQSVTRTFDIGNSGNLALTLTKAAPPAAPFAAANPIAEGQVLNPGDVVHQSVTFTPTAVGAATGTYLLTADDGTGPKPVTFTGAGTAPAGVVLPSPGAGGWSVNGAAKMSGADLQLTQTATNTAGSAVFPTPVLTDGLHVPFTAVIGGGTGADGMTFTVLDPARSSTTSLGAAGGGLGYSGLTGVAVTFDTYQHGVDPSANVVAVATSGTGSTLTYAATSTAVSNLRTGTHAVDVTVTAAGHLLVTVDSAAVIDVPVTLPPNAIVGFTGGTGGKTDQHAVRNVVISY